MANERRRRALVVLALVLVVAGCKRGGPSVASLPPVTVSVSRPLHRESADVIEYTGRTAAVNSVEVRSRVNGYLTKIDFNEGDYVEVGQLLYQIDARPYQAEVDRTSADVARWQAQLARTKADLVRADKLIPTRTISQEDYDRTVADNGIAQASLRASEAAAEEAQLNLEFTRITAPIKGRVSRTQITVGNLVQSDVTQLTNIVSTDPIYCYFDIDERTMLIVQKAIREGKVPSARETEVPLQMGLTTDKGYPFTGIINFVDNQVDPITGTIRIRGVFRNEREILSPGLFARVRIVLGKPREALMVSERAISIDQGRKYVLVVDAKNRVEYRDVEVGRLDNGLRVIEQGLSSDDRVIVIGIQRVRPGVEVQPKEIPMPEADQEAKTEPAAASATATPEDTRPAAAPAAEASSPAAGDAAEEHTSKPAVEPQNNPAEATP